jgi:hypothetical protein
MKSLDDLTAAARKEQLMRALATAAPRLHPSLKERRVPLRNGGGSLVLSLAVLETGGWPAAVSTAG